MLEMYKWQLISKQPNHGRIEPTIPLIQDWWIQTGSLDSSNKSSGIDSSNKPVTRASSTNPLHNAKGIGQGVYILSKQGIFCL